MFFTEKIFGGFVSWASLGSCSEVAFRRGSDPSSFCPPSDSEAPSLCTPFSFKKFLDLESSVVVASRRLVVLSFFSGFGETPGFCSLSLRVVSKICILLGESYDKVIPHFSLL